MIKNKGLEYVVIEEHAHPKIDSPNYNNFRTFTSLKDVERNLAQYLGDGTVGTRGWKITAHLAERVRSAEGTRLGNPVNQNASLQGTYFALYEDSMGERNATKHQSFDTACNSAREWKKKNPFGEAFVARELEFEFKLHIKK